MSTPMSGSAAATAVNPYAPPRASVRDIPDTSVTSQPAERGTRLGAYLLDGIVFGLMVYVPIIAVVIAADSESSVGAVIGGVLALVGLVAWIWLTILYVVRNGQSIGKKMLGIKVVRRDGSPVSFGRLFWLRNVVNGLISIIPLYAFVEVLFIFGESRQCLHDRLADTIVVKA